MSFIDKATFLSCLSAQDIQEKKTAGGFIFMPLNRTIEKIREFVRENSECELLSVTYVNNTSNLTFRCACGNEFKTSLKEFKGRKDRNSAKRQCNECGLRSRINKRTKPHSKFTEEVCGLIKGEYTVMSEYVTALEGIILKHNGCKTVFTMAPNDFLKGQRCPMCYGTPKKNTDLFKQDVKNLVGDEYRVIGEYDGNKIKTLMQHNICGYRWKTTPNSFLRGTFCPKCAVKSKGELRIREFLSRHRVAFKEQFRINECRHINSLPFDFAIFENDNIKFLLEYDGEQHFKVSRFNKDKRKMVKRLKNIQLRDKIKTRYCKDNNINLLRIPYTEFDNIYLILENYLLQQKILY